MGTCSQVLWHFSCQCVARVSRIPLVSEAAAVLFPTLFLFSPSQVTLVIAVYAEPTPKFYAMSCSPCAVPNAYLIIRLTTGNGKG